MKKDKGQQHQLNDEETSQLREVYKATNRGYGHLEALYQAERKQARVARKLTSFPTIFSWQPVSRNLTTTEKNMLRCICGGVVKFLYCQLADKRKNDVWVLRGSDLESERREGCTKASYICVNQEGKPCFGRVKHFYHLQFDSQEQHLAIVDWFSSPKQDVSSKLWYVPVAEVTGTPTYHKSCTRVSSTTLVHVVRLSKPLVTATTDNKLWFLNYPP